LQQAARKLAVAFRLPPAPGFLRRNLTYMWRVELNIAGDDPAKARGQSKSSTFNLLWNMELIIPSSCAKVDL
jgi:hypothetical protein